MDKVSSVIFRMDKQEKTGRMPEESYQIRCPKLGHQISFSYCRNENGFQPCPRILDCWFEHFDVEAHLKEELSPEAVEKLRLPPRPKLLSLIELIEQAKKKA